MESNLFGRLLEFFGDPGHRGRIVAVAASNRPDLVDAALFRPGRFDVKVPLLPPETAAERAEVFGAALRRYGHADPERLPLAACGARTEAGRRPRSSGRSSRRTAWRGFAGCRSGPRSTRRWRCCGRRPATSV